MLYLPALNIPEPGISRASGLLVPQFSTSDKVGFSSKIPYYFVIDNNKDLTVTPFIMSKKKRHTRNRISTIYEKWIL